MKIKGLYKSLIYSTVLLFVVFFFQLPMRGMGQEKQNTQDQVEDVTDFSLEELLNVEVTTASKKAEKVSDAPGIITVVSAKDIRAFGAVTLMDVLQRVTGLQPVSSHLFRQNVSSIRGDLLTHSDNHVLILLDGRPMREGVNGGINSPIYTTFPVDMIARIEVVRGPGSVLYGTNAYSGVINIITRQAPEQFEMRLTGGGGSLGGMIAGMSTGATKGDFQFNLSARYFKEDGWNMTALTPRPRYPVKSLDMEMSEDKFGIAAYMKYKGFRLAGFYSKGSEDTIGILPYAPFKSKNNLRRLFLDLGYTVNLSSAWALNINLTHNLADSKLNDENANIAPNYHYGSDWLGEINLSGSLGKQMNLTVGTVLDSRHKFKVPEFSPVKQTYHFYNWSAYAQVDYRPVEPLKIIAGFQFNKPDGGDSDIVPRFGVIYGFKNGFGVKVLYGQAFRSPSPIELLIDRPVLHGNPDLEPEKIATLDLQLFYTGKKLECALTYFNSSYKNLIKRIPYSGGGQVFSNEGTMKVEGLEFEMKANVTPRFFVTGSAAYQNNKDGVTASPDTIIKLGAAYTSPMGLEIGLFNSYFGKPMKNNGQVLNPEAEAVNLLSLNIGYTFKTKFPLRLSVYAQNLLDEDYYFPEFARKWVNTLPMASGRVIYAALSVGF